MQCRLHITVHNLNNIIVIIIRWRRRRRRKRRRRGKMNRTLHQKFIGKRERDAFYFHIRLEFWALQRRRKRNPILRMWNGPRIGNKFNVRASWDWIQSRYCFSTLRSRDSLHKSFLNGKYTLNILRTLKDFSERYASLSHGLFVHFTIHVIVSMAAIQRKH